MNELIKEKFFRILPYLNFVLSFFIVIHHSFNINVDFNATEKSVSWIVERYLYNLSECAVPVFFFISAVLFYRDYDGSLKMYITKVKKRLNSLMLPYLIFNIFGYFKHIVVSGESIGIFSMVKSIILSDTMPLWFLRELMILVLLAPIVYQVKNHKIISWGGILLIFILASIGIIKYRMFIYWFPIYCLGSVIDFGKFKDKFQLLFTHKFIMVLLLILYFTMAWILPNSSQNKNYIGNLVYYIYRWYSVLVVIIMVEILLEKSINVAPQWMKYSFWVYCVHFPMISLYTLMFEKLFQVNSSLLELIEYFSTIVIVYFCAILIAVIIKKITPNLWKILNGGRM